MICLRHAEIWHAALFVLLIFAKFFAEVCTAVLFAACYSCRRRVYLVWALLSVAVSVALDAAQWKLMEALEHGFM